MVRSAIIAIVGIVLVSAPAEAFGARQAGSPPPGNGLSAVWQYVEVVPTSRGPHVETGQKRPGPTLPAAVSRSLRQTPLDKALREAATSERYGAQARVPKRTSKTHLTASAANGDTASAPSVFGGRLIVLLTLLGGSTLAALGYRFRRGR